MRPLVHTALYCPSSPVSQVQQPPDIQRAPHGQCCRHMLPPSHRYICTALTGTTGLSHVPLMGGAAVQQPPPSPLPPPPPPPPDMPRGASSLMGGAGGTGPKGRIQSCQTLQYCVGRSGLRAQPERCATHRRQPAANSPVNSGEGEGSWSARAMRSTENAVCTRSTNSMNSTYMQRSTYACRSSTHTCTPAARIPHLVDGGAEGRGHVQTHAHPTWLMGTPMRGEVMSRPTHTPPG